VRDSSAVRTPGWDVRLAEVVEGLREAPFAWGTADCLTMVADVDLAMTGHDPMAGQRGKYRSAGGAVRLMRKLGYVSIDTALGALYPETGPAMARRGDCGLVAANEGTFLFGAVVVLGDVVMARASQGGLTLLPRERLLRAYRIG
jgi:hypothetical protein